MNIVSNIAEWQQIRKNILGKSIGFVPTMGHLHAGHISLCEQSKSENDITVVTIFVNPTQFNQSSDFERYPRTLEQDIKCIENKVDYLIVPSATDIYPDQFQFKIIEDELSKELEGEFRPGHFSGMLTIVLKLLNLVQPTKAYFGEKDYQQLLLIKKMVEALFLPVTIVACETMRDTDGLALSSRNSRLNKDQRDKATSFPHLLKSSSTTEQIVKDLELLGFKVDYIVDKWQRRLGAVWVDDVRLIDNISL